MCCAEHDPVLQTVRLIIINTINQNNAWGADIPLWTSSWVHLIRCKHEFPCTPIRVVAIGSAHPVTPRVPGRVQDPIQGDMLSVQPNIK